MTFELAALLFNAIWAYARRGHRLLGDRRVHPLLLAADPRRDRQSGARGPRSDVTRNAGGRNILSRNGVQLVVSWRAWVDPRSVGVRGGGAWTR
jgi:hypothetical protein